MTPHSSSSSSRSLRHSSRHTRGPLQELPLDQFLLPPSTSSKHGSNTKRPVSPGTPTLYSPAKRRILNEEGFFAAKSPVSATAVTASARTSSSKQFMKASQNFYQQQQQTSARFSDALMGPDSPARKLDFGPPKNAVGSKTPLRQSAGEKLASSPEIKAGLRSRLRSFQADEDCFSIPFRSQTQFSPPQAQSQSQTTFSSSSSGSCSQPPRYLDFLPVPRELPSPTDPLSEHYPGFAIYQDPHILIPRLRLTSPAHLLMPSSSLTPIDGNLNDFEVELVDSRELVKENLPPRTKVRKAAMADTPEKRQLFSSPSAKSSSVPVTPPPGELTLQERDALTPRPLSIFGVGVGPELGKAQHKSSKPDRHIMRRILEVEVDGEQEYD